MAPREVSDIVVTFGDERTRAQAQQRVDEIEARLQQGDDFADLAKQSAIDQEAIEATDAKDFDIYLADILAVYQAL